MNQKCKSERYISKQLDPGLFANAPIATLSDIDDGNSKIRPK